MTSLPPTLDHHYLIQSILNSNSQSELYKKQISLYHFPAFPRKDCHFHQGLWSISSYLTTNAAQPFHSHTSLLPSSSSPTLVFLPFFCKWQPYLRVIALTVLSAQVSTNLLHLMQIKLSCPFFGSVCKMALPPSWPSLPFPALFSSQCLVH